MRRKKTSIKRGICRITQHFFWQRKNPTFIESPKGSTVQAAQYNHAGKKRVLGMLAYIQNQFQGSICRITQQFQDSICRSWKRARTHTQWFTQYCVIGMLKTGRWRHGKQRKSVPMCAGHSGSINMPDYDSFRMNTHPWRVNNQFIV